MSDNLGAYQVDHVSVEVTDLTNAGNEPLSTWTDSTDIDVIDGVSVVGQTDPSSAVLPDPDNDLVNVQDLSDGSDVAAGTDVGTITLRIEGRR